MEPLRKDLREASMESATAEGRRNLPPVRVKHNARTALETPGAILE